VAIVCLVGGALAGVLGIALVLWSGWLYDLVASSAESKYTPSALVVFGTIVLALGAVCVYLAFRLVRRSRKRAATGFARLS